MDVVINLSPAPFASRSAGLIFAPRLFANWVQTAISPLSSQNCLLLNGANCSRISCVEPHPASGCLSLYYSCSPSHLNFTGTQVSSCIPGSA